MDVSGYVGTNKMKIRKKTSKDRLPLPSWMKIRPPTTDLFANIKQLLKEKHLNTVCAQAVCPNITECWSGGTATFMVMGDTCTRGCRFCAVKTGNPEGVLDEEEPRNLVEAIKIMNLKYVVLTCVTRDDLKDGGAAHWQKCVSTIQKYDSSIKIELLISDLNGNMEALKVITDANPDILGHNIETVERLQSKVRDPRANYKKSLKILEETKKQNPKIYTKTSLMLGLGETTQEVVETMQDARRARVDIITFGQYLQPSNLHLQVKEYISPDQFSEYKTLAKQLGFLYCASGPFVRSSYRAGEYFMKNITNVSG